MTTWPALPLGEWRDTRDTLHMWTQIVGKIRLALTPMVNHWWNATLYVSARGLTTGVMPCGDQWLDIEFDFIDHRLRIRLSSGAEKRVPLAPRSVADFYAETMSALASLGVTPKIWATPVEISDPIPFQRDERHHAYDGEYARRFWRVLAEAAAVLNEFRVRFIGKCSPVHFFWGSFDLAVTRFSGRLAPPHPDFDAVNREAYSHEVSSVGWWPGDERLDHASFYAYAAPEPEGFRAARVQPAEAYFDAALGGFYLPYDAVRTAPDPSRMLLDFCQSTYVAAADLGKWDRAALER